MNATPATKPAAARTEVVDAQFDQALAAHRQWMNRLARCIDLDTRELEASLVAEDHHCDFGRWLYGRVHAADKRSPHYGRVKTLHAQFHAEAGRVLALALTGRKAEAQAALAPEGRYNRLSEELVAAIAAWQQAYPGTIPAGASGQPPSP